MNFTVRNDAFQCRNCGAEVPPQEGSCRNHCPACLHSLHVDADFPGDRASKCEGLMAPTGLHQTGKKGWIVLHTCLKCGESISNKLAPDDNMELVIKLSQQPFAPSLVNPRKTLHAKPARKKPYKM